jgi:hypothetical protein
MHLLSYSSGLVSLIRLSIDILSEATILKPYRLIVRCASCSSPAESITGTPISKKDMLIIFTMKLHLPPSPGPDRGGKSFGS